MDVLLLQRGKEAFHRCEYVEIFYNRQRLHSRIGYRTPAQAREDMAKVSIGMAA